MKVTVLGCGGSGGVPLIGNNWGSCNPEQPRNRRRRVSVLVQHEGANIVLDTSPDFREQMLDADVGKLDCDVSKGIGVIVGSKQDLDCTFTPSASGDFT